MNTRLKGILGEDVACAYLTRLGFVVLARNYSKKWGELDIIAKKDNSLHFFEVKSAICRLVEWGRRDRRPEENVHGFKIRQIRRMIETYFVDNDLSPETQFHFHVLSVFMDTETRQASVKWIKDVIL